MKQTENNEMDLLLRSLARRESRFEDRVAEEQASGSHLDSDELNSYSEHALPAATRARYTIHLADCSRCRKLVAELSSVAGIYAREHAAQQDTPAGFWTKIGQLFSLPVLRYAVPALSLFVVVAIGLIVFRQQRRQELVARNEPAAGLVAVPEDKQAGPPSGHSSETMIREPSSARSDSAPSPNADQTTTSERNQGKASSSDKAEAGSPKKDSPAESIVAEVAQPTFAPEPAPAPPAKAEGAVADAKREGAARTESAARPQSAASNEKAGDRDNVARVEARTQQEERERAKGEDRQRQVAGAPASSPQPRRGLAKLRTAEGGRGDVAGNKKADDEAEETRSVGGRHFRRQGGIWVDAAYRSGVTVITLVRGSEQYRALVSDEPAIRTIADELPGEIVLVWKGRGYRIR